MSKDAVRRPNPLQVLLTAPSREPFRQKEAFGTLMVVPNFGQIPIVPDQLANKGPITFVTFVFLTTAPRIAP